MARIGVDIGGTKIHIVAFEKDGKLLSQQKLSSHTTLSDGPTPGAALASHIESFFQNNHLSIQSIEGIVIGFPGIMDVSSGTIITCPNLPILDKQPLSVEIQQRLNIPTYLENDVNLIALGEHANGRGKGVDDLVCLFVGSGLGCALILDGELYNGADGLSGEFGHIPIEPHGLRCTCGGIGCLEMYCSGKALSLRAGVILGASHQEQYYVDNPWAVAEKIIQAAHEGHELAVQALDEAFFYLGLGVVILVNTLNPRMVILGGGILNGWPQGLETVRRVVAERGRTGARESVSIEFPMLIELPHLHGANAFLDKQLR